MLERWKEFIKRMNEKGIYIPLIRIDGQASFTGTLTLIAFINALISQWGKVTQVLGAMDTSAAQYLFLTTIGIHFGKKIMGDGKKVEVEGGKNNVQG